MLYVDLPGYAALGNNGTVSVGEPAGPYVVVGGAKKRGVGNLNHLPEINTFIDTVIESLFVVIYSIRLFRNFVIWKRIMTEAVIVVVSCMLAGFVQAVAGFGCGMVMMLILPLSLGFTEAVGITGTISIAVHAALLFIYRHSVDLKKMLLPTFIYSTVCILVIGVVKYLDIGLLEMMFGVFLIAVALFFFFFSNKVKIKEGIVSSTVCCGLSGVFSALFSIGGPLISIYYSSIFSDHDTYIGSTQFLFLVSVVTATITRVANGLYTADLIPYSVEGIIGILLGALIGVKVSRKMKIELVRKIIYVCVGLTGIVAVLQNI